MVYRIVYWRQYQSVQFVRYSARLVTIRKIKDFLVAKKTRCSIIGRQGGSVFSHLTEDRAIAIAQLVGPERGLAEIAAIANCERLAAYPFYQAAMGELEFRCGRYAGARQHFRAAVAVTRNPAERGFLERRERACGDCIQP